MSEEQILFRHKLDSAIQQMQFVMSDIFVYVTNGKENRNKVANQFLQSYPDLEV